MGRENERDMEKLLCGGAFSNPMHKEALPTPEGWELWPRPQAE